MPVPPAPWERESGVSSVPGYLAAGLQTHGLLQEPTMRTPTGPQRSTVTFDIDSGSDDVVFFADITWQIGQ
jgi:hypothetical protein